MLPAGGNAAVMFTKDPAAQAAAWQYIAFATGPVAQTIMVKATGYMPTSEQAVDTRNISARITSRTRVT